MVTNGSRAFSARVWAWIARATTSFPVPVSPKRSLGHFQRALDRALPRVAAAIAADRVSEELRGPVAHSGFTRLI
jgi:hypothetical protein